MLASFLPRPPFLLGLHAGWPFHALPERPSLSSESAQLHKCNFYCGPLSSCFKVPPTQNASTLPATPLAPPTLRFPPQPLALILTQPLPEPVLPPPTFPTTHLLLLRGPPPTRVLLCVLLSPAAPELSRAPGSCLVTVGKQAESRNQWILILNTHSESI